MEKYQGSDDPVFRERCVQIKEERADLVKHHLWVLWTDYFKPPHLEKYPELHDLFWQATKAAGDAKKSLDPSQGEQLLGLSARSTRSSGRPSRARDSARRLQPPLTGGSTATSSFGPTGVFDPSVGSLPFTHTRLISRTAAKSAP